MSDQKFGKYMSLVAPGDRILALDETGRLYLIVADPEKLRILDSMQVSDESTWAHLAILGRRFAVREFKGLKVFEFRKPTLDSGGSGL